MRLLSRDDRVSAIAPSVFTMRTGGIRDSPTRVYTLACALLRARRASPPPRLELRECLTIPSDRSPDRSLDRRLDRQLDRSRDERRGQSGRNGNSVPISCTAMSLRNVRRMFRYNACLETHPPSPWYVWRCVVHEWRSYMNARNGIASMSCHVKWIRSKQDDFYRYSNIPTAYNESV